MGQDPEVIRAEIQRTRAEMDDTVDALGYKADVKGRARESVQDKVDSVRSAVTGATPDPNAAKAKGKQAVGVAQGNPLGLAIGAAAVGFLAGMLIPETRKEHETLGEAADQVKSQVKDTAQEAMSHGKEVAQQVATEAGQTAKETAQQAAQEHGEQLKETAQQNAQQGSEQVRSQVGSS